MMATKLGAVAENFPLVGAKVFDRGFLKIMLNFSYKLHIVGMYAAECPFSSQDAR